MRVYLVVMLPGGKGTKTTLVFISLSLSLSLPLCSSIPLASLELLKSRLSFLWSFPITSSILFVVFNRTQKGTIWFCFRVIAGQSLSEKVLLSLSFHFWPRG